MRAEDAFTGHAELDLCGVAGLRHRRGLPGPRIPHERADASEQAAVVPMHDEERPHPVRLPAPHPALEMLDCDLDAPGLGADPAHHLRIADEIQKHRGVVECRRAEQKPFRLDLRHPHELNRYRRRL